MTGWTGLPEVPIDGKSWPLTFAAELLDFPEKDLRELIRITGLKPIGTIKNSDFARQGRNPRAYDSNQLIKLVNGIRELMVQSSMELGTVPQVRQGLAALGLAWHGAAGQVWQGVVRSGSVRFGRVRQVREAVTVRCDCLFFATGMTELDAGVYRHVKVD